MEKITDRSPRVLVTTVPAWSKGSNTLSSLFKGYDKSKLACLYIRADKSDAQSCNRYFHIIESKILKSVFIRQEKTGEEYIINDELLRIDTINKQTIEREEKIYSFFRLINSYFIILIRELVWMIGKWKTKEFNDFVNSVNPEVLVFPIESYIHFNRINEYLIQKYKPKRIIGFLWDDNFSYKQHPYDLCYLLHRFWLRLHVRKLVNACDVVFVLSPKMKKECDSEFKINSELLSKPIFNNGFFRAYTVKNPIRILYTGSLLIGRDKTILEIAKVIQQMNSNGIKVELNIYSNTVISNRKKHIIERGGSCRVLGAITQKEVFKKQEEADILLFAESFSNVHRIARLSFSTKLTDYFSAGKCIWAVGNRDLGPIEYLKENDAGLVSTDIQSVKDILSQVINNPFIVEEYAKKSFKCGIINHNEDKILKKFRNALME